MRPNNAYAPIQQVRDVQPIRATCFHPNGQAYVVGTNSKALKICKYPDKDERKNLTSGYINNRLSLESTTHDIASQTNNENNDTTNNSCNHVEQKRLSNLKEPELAFTCLHIHCGSVYCCRFNQAGDLLATGSNDQIVHVIKYNPEKHMPDGAEYKLSSHSGTVRDLCFMRGENKSHLVSAGAGENEINVTDCNTMKLTQVLRGHESAIMSLDCFNNSSSTFASGSLDGTIRLWDLRSRQSVLTITAPSSFKNDTNGNASLRLDSASPSSEAASEPKFPMVPAESDSALMLSDACEDGRKVAMDPPPAPQEHHHQEPSNKGSPVGVIRVDPTDRLLVSGHKDGQCMLHDVRANKPIQIFQAHEDEIRTLNFSPNSYYLLTAGYDHKIKLMDLQGHLGKKLPSVELAELDDKVVQTAWHPVDYNFVTTCADGTATLWTIPDFDTWIESIQMD